MYKIIYGECPTQKREYSISVNYLNASAHGESCYVKGTFRCEYNIYSEHCFLSDCPIYESAPETLQNI